MRKLDAAAHSQIVVETWGGRAAPLITAATSVIAKHRPLLGGHPFSSLMVSVDTAEDWERSEDPVPGAYLLVFGDFSGGRYVEWRQGETLARDVKDSILIISRWAWHCTAASEGKRIAIVGFAHPALPHASAEQQEDLRRLGFCLEAPAAAQWDAIDKPKALARYFDTVELDDRAAVLCAIWGVTSTEHDVEIVRAGSKYRAFRDGAGPSSPGLIRPSSRHQSPLGALGARLKAYAASEEIRWYWDAVDGSRLEMDTQNPLKESPFPEGAARKVRRLMCDFLGMDAEDAEVVEPGQCFHLALLRALAEQAGDLDVELLDFLVEGCPLGVEEPLTAPDGVLYPKDRTEVDELDPHSEENYPGVNVEANLQHLLDNYMEDAQLDMVGGPYDSEEELAAALGVLPKDVVYGALAVVDEAAGKKRTVHDGSSCGANGHIQQHISQKGSCPGPADVRHAMAVSASEGIELAAVVIDAAKAHRRCKVAKKDWRYMGARFPRPRSHGGPLGALYFFNKVGTYGFASAQFFWGRLAGMVQRLLLAVGLMDWAFTYVDDLLHLLEVGQVWPGACAVLLFLLALGFPISWKKLRIGRKVGWTGHVVDLELRLTRPAQDKLRQVTEFCETLVAGERVGPRVVLPGVARCRWLAQDAPHATPFLMPLHRWAAAIKGPSTPSALVSCAAEYFIMEMHAEPAKAGFFAPYGGEAATDAGADDAEATIGGWVSQSSPAVKAECRWFSLVIPRKLHPWVWSRGENPKRCIAALELLALIYLVRMIAEEKAPNMHLKVKGISDNKGNTHALMGCYNRKLPGAAVQMELSSCCARSQVWLEIDHAKRDFNKWADQLTHDGDVDGFSPHLRWDAAALGTEDFPVLSKLCSVSAGRGFEA